MDDQREPRPPPPLEVVAKHVVLQSFFRNPRGALFCDYIKVPFFRKSNNLFEDMHQIFPLRPWVH